MPATVQVCWRVYARVVVCFARVSCILRAFRPNTSSTRGFIKRAWTPVYVLCQSLSGWMLVTLWLTRLNFTRETSHRAGDFRPNRLSFPRVIRARSPESIDATFVTQYFSFIFSSFLFFFFFLSFRRQKKNYTMLYAELFDAIYFLTDAKIRWKKNCSNGQLETTDRKSEWRCFKIHRMHTFNARYRFTLL